MFRCTDRAAGRRGRGFSPPRLRGDRRARVQQGWLAACWLVPTAGLSDGEMGELEAEVEAGSAFGPPRNSSREVREEMARCFDLVMATIAVEAGGAGGGRRARRGRATAGPPARAVAHRRPPPRVAQLLPPRPRRRPRATLRRPKLRLRLRLRRRPSSPPPKWKPARAAQQIPASVDEPQRELQRASGVDDSRRSTRPSRRRTRRRLAGRGGIRKKKCCMSTAVDSRCTCPKFQKRT